MIRSTETFNLARSVQPRGNECVELLREWIRARQWPCSVPMFLTFGRIALVPVFAIVFIGRFDAYWPVSAGVLALASLTDWLDGAIARFTRQTTRLGAFLDPVADKLLIVTALVLLSHRSATLWVVIPSVVIVIRELSVSALREWTAQCGSARSTKVSWIGKLKTTLQMVALVILLMTHTVGSNLWWIGIAFLNVAALCAVVSLIDYLFSAWPTLRDPLNAKPSASI